VSHRGLIREANEDRCHVGPWRSGPDGGRWQGTIDPGGIYAAIADGMGGHRKGEIASTIAIDCVAEMAPDVTREQDVVNMIEEANERIFAAMQTPFGYPAMGTTIAGVVIRNHRGMIYNVGDSRAYLLSGSQLIRMSRDHTPPATTGNSRSHALTQSLGGTGSRIGLSPHLVTFDLDGLEAVLLCSDGLSDMVDEGRIEEILNSDRLDPVSTLLAAALQAGGRDNISAILVRLTDV
jgi:protein phosphatase